MKRNDCMCSIIDRLNMNIISTRGNSDVDNYFIVGKEPFRDMTQNNRTV